MGITRFRVGKKYSMFSKEHPIIIFLDRSGFIIYQDTLSNVWQFPFSQDLVQNLDVVNKEQLINLIGSFIQTNKVIPSSLIIVLSDSVIFQKDLTGLQPKPESQQPSLQASLSPDKTINKHQIDFANKELQEKEIKNFLDNVPFEEVLAKVINNTRIVVVNKDLLEAIVDPFKKIGCIVNAVVPCFMYQQYIDFSGGLSQDIARVILQQEERLKLGNMLTGQPIKTQQDPYGEPQKAPKEKSNNLRQFILIVVFVFLLIVLAIVYLTLGRTPQASPSPIAPSPTAALQTEPTSSPTDRNASSSAVDLQTIKITIIGNKETAILDNGLKNLLSKSGFQNIAIKDSTNPVPARPSVLFTKSVPDSLRQKVIAEIKKIFPDVLVQEAQELEPMITIVIGKS